MSKTKYVKWGFLLLYPLCFIHMDALVLFFQSKSWIYTSSYLEKPSSLHLWGTDILGRDIWNYCWLAIPFSLGTSLWIGSVSSTIGIFLGGQIYLLPSYWRKKVLQWIRFFLTVPHLLWFLILLEPFPPTPWMSLLVLTLTQIPFFLDLAYTHSIEFYTSSELWYWEGLGLTSQEKYTLTIKPLLSQKLYAQVLLRLRPILMSLTFLSFLGKGIPLDIPEWGNMISQNIGVIFSAPYTILFPSLFMAVVFMASTWISLRHHLFSEPPV